MRTLHDLVRAGKVTYLGASSMFAYQLSKAQYIAKYEGLTPFVSMQNFYNLTYREEEREMMPLAQEWGMGVIPWSPLARGALTGKNRNTTRTKSDPFYTALAKTNQSEETIIDRAYEVAEKKGCTVPQVALAWQYTKVKEKRRRRLVYKLMFDASLSFQPYITSPIVGVSKKAHLDDLIGALKVKLTPEEVKYLEEPYQPKRIAGHM